MDWLIDLPIYWLIDWLIHLLIDRSIDWFIHSFIYCLIDGLIDWLIGYFFIIFILFTGFYIRDGVNIKVTPVGLDKIPGIFISRLVAGGLAESTGLISVNDEIIEVNGIEVLGKTLDQVTDMMIANSSNLIITVKPANQRLANSPPSASGAVHDGKSASSTSKPNARHANQQRMSKISVGSGTSSTGHADDDEIDEVLDLTGEFSVQGNHSGSSAGSDRTSSSTSSSAASTSVLRPKERNRIVTNAHHMKTSPLNGSGKIDQLFTLWMLFFSKNHLIGFFLSFTRQQPGFFFIFLGCLFVNLIILDLCTSAAGHFLGGFNFFCKLYSSARLLFLNCLNQSINQSIRKSLSGMYDNPINQSIDQKRLIRYAQ